MLLVAAETEKAKTEAKEAPAKPKPPAKAPAKPLPQLMEEDVIPALLKTLEAQNDLSEIELSFGDNRVSHSLINTYMMHQMLQQSQSIYITTTST